MHKRRGRPKTGAGPSLYPARMRPAFSIGTLQEGARHGSPSGTRPCPMHEPKRAGCEIRTAIGGGCRHLGYLGHLYGQRVFNAVGPLHPKINAIKIELGWRNMGRIFDRKTMKYLKLTGKDGRAPFCEWIEERYGIVLDDDLRRTCRHICILKGTTSRRPTPPLTRYQRR